MFRSIEAGTLSGCVCSSVTASSGDRGLTSLPNSSFRPPMAVEATGTESALCEEAFLSGIGVGKGAIVGL
jgi:hypothetical protein